MLPFILIGLAIFLILIVLSVCAYPFICASIVINCKRYKEIVTGILLIVTIAFYLFACTNLEHAFDDWCYSVYAGIVLTPIVLYFCTGSEEPKKWSENGRTPPHHKIVIPLITFLTSSLFAIEGCLRMAHSFSAHKMIKYGWGNTDDSWWYYYDYEEFHYAGSLLFCVSLISALVIGISFISGYKAYRQKLIVEEEKKSRIEGEINSVTQRLNNDDALLMAAEAQQVDDEVKKPNQYIAGNSPKTLEECFYDIILKRGTDILKDKNILNIMSSLYKDLDISEYKDILTEMSKENFLYQFVEPNKQKDFVLYNLSSSFAHKQKINSQKCLFVIQALVKALKKTP